MSNDDDWYVGLRNAARRCHDQRVAKTPQRIAYAIDMFERHGIRFALKNEAAGHFHCWRKVDNQLFQYYAGTGKIQGQEDARGIHALIAILNANRRTKNEDQAHRLRGRS